MLRRTFPRASAALKGLPLDGTTINSNVKSAKVRYSVPSTRRPSPRRRPFAVVLVSYAVRLHCKDVNMQRLMHWCRFVLKQQVSRVHESITTVSSTDSKYEVRIYFYFTASFVVYLMIYMLTEPNYCYYYTTIILLTHYCCSCTTITITIHVGSTRFGVMFWREAWSCSVGWLPGRSFPSTR